MIQTNHWDYIWEHEFISLFTTYEYYIFFQKISVNLILFKKTVKSFIKLVVQVINNFECADQLHCGSMRWRPRARGRTRPLPPPRQMGRLWLQLAVSWQNLLTPARPSRVRSSRNLTIPKWWFTAWKKKKRGFEWLSWISLCTSLVEHCLALV